MSRQTTDTVLMIRPVAFRMNEQTAVNNYYQKVIDSLTPGEVQARALQEFDTFVAKLRTAGIRVLVIEDTPDPATPDSIFPNNWVSFHENGEILLYPMFAENRRAERRSDILDALNADFLVGHVHDFTSWETQNKFLEGTGSLLLDRVNKLAYAAVSERTHPDVLADFERYTGYQGIPFTANQSVKGARLPIYHTNVMMCLGEQFAVICLDSIDDESERNQVLQKLRVTNKEIIAITEAQKERFAGNMLQLCNQKGDKYIVMSESAYTALDSDQLTRLGRYGQLLHSSLDTIEALGGGSARCMLAEVFLQKKKYTMDFIEKELKQAISQAFSALFDFDLQADSFALQPTRKEFEGTHTFVVFPYARQTRKSPEESGTMIGEYLKKESELVADFNVVKGFVNLSLTDETWIRGFHALSLESEYGVAPANGTKVMVEFSSPNTNKPLHLGHLRNNFLGDSVSRILKASGYDVMKVNLVNDRGIHICKSMIAYALFGNDETPESAGMKGDHLIGKYYVRFDQEYKKEIEGLIHQGADPEEAKKEAPLILKAQEMLKKWEEGDTETVALWKKLNSWVYEGFDVSYATMGITFDKVYHESETYLLGKDIIAEGLGKGVFFKKEDGSVWVDLTDQKLDEKLVLRGDGTSVYITQDIGTCDLKHHDFPFEKSVYVVGNEQDHHFKVLFSIMDKLGRPYAQGLHHLSYGMVDLPSGKMKSREGTVVDADDLMQEMFETAETQTRELGKIEGLSADEAAELYRTLGLGALKYFLLKVDPKKRMMFNPQESIEFQGNTGPFIQYTHARISAIIRRAVALEMGAFDVEKIKSLHTREVELIAQLGEFPKVIAMAAADYSPSLVAQYVYELAKLYNGFYQDIPIFNEDDLEVVKFRITLSGKVAEVINRGMGLLGIRVPERM